MFVLVRDSTERKRAEETLFQQTREVAVLEERNRMDREIHDTLAKDLPGLSSRPRRESRHWTRAPARCPST